MAKLIKRVANSDLPAAEVNITEGEFLVELVVSLPLALLMRSIQHIKSKYAG